MTLPPVRGNEAELALLPVNRGWPAMWTNVPLQWDVKSGAGVLWKAAVPAPGHNSPIVWDDREFLSGGHKTSRTFFCFHAVNGDLLWQRVLDLLPP